MDVNEPQTPENNSIPICISTQSVPDIKDTSLRLNIPFDMLSDKDLKLVKKLKLPILKVDNNVYIKKLTLIVEKNTIIKIFFPIISINKHIDEILLWLKEN